jgi:hypothetical protein
MTIGVFVARYGTMQRSKVKASENKWLGPFRQGLILLLIGSVFLCMERFFTNQSS